MAHFVSEVTRQKMDSRREDAQRTQTETFACVGDVLGYIRCAAVSVRGDARANCQPHEVWCGEQDGVIVVRDIEQGTPNRTIERKPQVFVFAMAGVGTEVWAGLSDGFIRVFDATTDRLVEEFKAHCASITSLTPLTYSFSGVVERVVFSTSVDWTIAKWSAENMACIARYSGHTNTVRCLAHTSDGEFVVSGSDDETVRLWSTVSHEELSLLTPPGDDNDSESSNANSGWPITHTNGSVTSVLVLHDQFVLIATKGGTVNVHALQSGAFLRELEQRPCAVSTMMYDDVNHRIYAGGVDGVLTLYDDKFPSFILLGAVQDHSGTYIANFAKLHRQSQFSLWAVGDQGGMSKLVDNEHLLTNTQWDRLDNLQQEVDVQRGVVLHNFQELEGLRTELQRLELVEQTRKDKMSITIGDDNMMKRDFMYRSLTWLQRSKHRRKVETLARWLEMIAFRRLAGRYKFKWVLFFKLATDLRRKRALSDTLLTAQSHSTAIRYSLMLHHAALKMYAKRKVLQAAQNLLTVSSRGQLHIYYTKWMKFRERRHAATVQKKVGEALLTKIDQTLLIGYWNRLAQLAQRDAIWRNKVRLLQGVGRLSAKGIMTLYLAKWTDWVRSCKRAKKAHENRLLKANVIIEDTVETNLALVRRYMQMWRSFLITGQERRAQEAQAKLQEERDMWADMISQSATMTEETIQQEREAVLAQIEAKMAEIRDADNDLMIQQHQNYDIQRDLTTCGARLELDPTMTLGTKMSTIMEYLKARGVNCHGDFLVISSVKEAAQKEQRTAATTRTTTPTRPTTPGRTTPSAAKKPVAPIVTAGGNFERALLQFRDRVRLAIEAIGYVVPKQNGDDWGFTFHALDRLKKKDIVEVLSYLKEVVVRYDVMQTMSATPEAALSEVCMTQFVLNSYIMIHLTNQEFQKSALEYTKTASNTSLASNKPGLKVSATGVFNAVVNEAKRHDPSTNRLQRSPSSRRDGGPPTPRTGMKTPRPTAQSRTKSPAPSPSPKTPRPTPTPKASTTGPRPSTSTPRPTRPSPAATTASSGKPRPFMGFKVAYATAKKDSLVVSELSPADECPAVLAGVEVGDKLLRFANFVVTDLAAFNAIVSRHVKIDASLPLQVQRNGEHIQLTINVGSKV